MNLTMNSGKLELQKYPSPAVGKVAEALSKGLLMGARGNSGVILSQLFRGFSKGIASQEQIDAQQFAAALQNGVDMAYKAVVKPVEGTILTVAKDTAKHAVAFAKRNNDIVQLLQEVQARANESLSRTPDLLPVLKQVGVVDSGGQGLVCIYEGFLSSLAEGNGVMEEIKVGKEAAVPAVLPAAARTAVQPAAAFQHNSAQSKLETDHIEFLYDMEFFIKRKQVSRTDLRFDEALFKGMLGRDGDSILVIVDDEIIKVHVHTRKPGDVLNYALPYGELADIHILNMREQHRDLLQQEESAAGAVNIQSAPADMLPETAVVEEAALGLAVSEVLTGTPADELSAEHAHEWAQFGLIAVAMGDGIRSIFLDNNVDVVLSGGQTMNPSTEDFVNAIETLAAEHVYVLPNNSNITLAAQQAAELSGRSVTVIGTKNIPQGLAAVLAFKDEHSAEMNTQAMNEAVLQVRSGQVTNAVRNTTIDGISIQEGDYIGIMEKTIVTASANLQETCRELLARMMEDGGELVTVLTGEQAKESDTAELTAWARDAFPDAEFEIHAGGQPLYPYLIAVE